METEVLVRFDPTRTRNRTKVPVGARLLEELKDGPLVLRKTHTQALAKYKKNQSAAGVEVPAFRTQKFEEDPSRSVTALADGPFERTVVVPEWIK